MQLLCKSRKMKFLKIHPKYGNTVTAKSSSPIWISLQGFTKDHFILDQDNKIIQVLSCQLYARKVRQNFAFFKILKNSCKHNSLAGTNKLATGKLVAHSVVQRPTLWYKLLKIKTYSPNWWGTSFIFMIFFSFLGWKLSKYVKKVFLAVTMATSISSQKYFSIEMWAYIPNNCVF